MKEGQLYIMGNKSKHGYSANDSKIKNLFKESLQKYGKVPNISDEQIYDAFARIDTHTKILNNFTIFQQYDSIVHILSSIVMQQENWNSDKETCRGLVEDYYSMFETETFNENNKDPKVKALFDSVKDYIINNCMIYYAIYHKDKEFLTECNKAIAIAARSIILAYTIINSPTPEKTEENSDSNTIVEVPTSEPNNIIDITKEIKK